MFAPTEIGTRPTLGTGWLLPEKIHFPRVRARLIFNYHSAGYVEIVLGLSGFDSEFSWVVV